MGPQVPDVYHRASAVAPRVRDRNRQEMAIGGHRELHVRRRRVLIAELAHVVAGGDVDEVNVAVDVDPGDRPAVAEDDPLVVHEHRLVESSSRSDPGERGEDPEQGRLGRGAGGQAMGFDPQERGEVAAGASHRRRVAHQCTDRRVARRDIGASPLLHRDRSGDQHGDGEECDAHQGAADAPVLTGVAAEPGGLGGSFGLGVGDRCVEERGLDLGEVGLVGVAATRGRCRAERPGRARCPGGPGCPIPSRRRRGGGGCVGRRRRRRATTATAATPGPAPRGRARPCPPRRSPAGPRRAARRPARDRDRRAASGVDPAPHRLAVGRRARPVAAGSPRRTRALPGGQAVVEPVGGSGDAAADAAGGAGSPRRSGRCRRAARHVSARAWDSSGRAPGSPSVSRTQQVDQARARGGAGLDRPVPRWPRAGGRRRAGRRGAGPVRRGG